MPLGPETDWTVGAVVSITMALLPASALAFASAGKVTVAVLSAASLSNAPAATSDVVAT